MFFLLVKEEPGGYPINRSMRSNYRTSLFYSTFFIAFNSGSNLFERINPEEGIPIFFVDYMLPSFF